jgi:serine/threonine protein kinase/tetratricopeptide (TPR) repeat protein
MGVPADEPRQLLEPVSAASDHPATTPPAGDEAAPLLSALTEPAQTPLTVTGYDVLAELGRGGMGVVYLARQPHLDRRVALKLLLDDVYAEESQRTRLRAEAAALARLRHPNVVQLFEMCERQGRIFLVLEYVEGPTLAQLCRGRPQPPRWAAQVTALLARAVHHVHRQGLLHRDLKPANVLLQRAARDDGGGAVPNLDPDPPAWVPKISDFGLAHWLDKSRDRSHSRVIVGTPSYIGPEQAQCQGHLLGPATDVWALGAVLFEMLTGRPPFLAESTVATLIQVVQDEPPRPAHLAPQVPPTLEAICLRCLHKDPCHRYATAAALADDLADFLNAPPAPVPLPPPRRRRWPTVAAASVLGALAPLAVVRWQDRQENVPPADPVPAAAATAPAPDQTEALELARICLRLADVDQAGGHLAQAEAGYRQALRRLGPVGREAPPRLAAAEAYLGLGTVLRGQGQLKEAEAAWRLALELIPPGPDPVGQKLAALGHNNLAAVLQLTGRPAAAEAAYRQALALYVPQVEAGTAEPGLAMDRAVCQANLGTLLQQQDRLAEAEEAYRQALAGLAAHEAALQESPAYPLARATAWNHLGGLLQLRGQEQEAEPCHRAALALLEPLGSVSTTGPAWRQELARAYHHLGVLAHRTGRLPLAIEAYRQAQALLEGLCAAYPQVAEYRRDCQALAEARAALGNVRPAAGP